MVLNFYSHFQRLPTSLGSCINHSSLSLVPVTQGSPPSSAPAVSELLSVSWRSLIPSERGAEDLRLFLGGGPFTSVITLLGSRHCPIPFRSADRSAPRFKVHPCYCSTKWVGLSCSRSSHAFMQWYRLTDHAIQTNMQCTWPPAIYSIFSLCNWRALHHNAACWSHHMTLLPSSFYGERCYGIRLYNIIDYDHCTAMLANVLAWVYSNTSTNYAILSVEW